MWHINTTIQFYLSRYPTLNKWGLKKWPDQTYHKIVRSVVTCYVHAAFELEQLESPNLVTIVLSYTKAYPILNSQIF